MKTLQKSFQLKLPTVKKTNKSIRLIKFIASTFIISLTLHLLTGISLWVIFSIILFYSSIYFLIFKIENNGSQYMP